MQPFIKSGILSAIVNQGNIMANAKKPTAKAKTTTSTAKKPTTKATAARKAPATKKAPVKKAAAKPAAKKAVSKAAQKPSFMTVQPTRETAYWLIFSLLILALGIWVLTLTIRINDIYDQIERNNSAVMSLDETAKTSAPE